MHEDLNETIIAEREHKKNIIRIIMGWFWGIVIMLIFIVILCIIVSFQTPKKEDIPEPIKDKDYVYIKLTGEKVQVRSIYQNGEYMHYDVRCQDYKIRTFEPDELSKKDPNKK